VEDVERDFLLDIILSPAYAVIPRAIWPSKPKGNLGKWYNREVLGTNVANSVGMGPISYLHFSGGVLAIFTGFMFVGILQRISYEYFLLSGGGYVIIFLVLLPFLVKVNSEFYILPIKVIRNTILAVIFQKAIIKK
jgi:hypothetical protein